jgi:hypothetical protein
LYNATNIRIFERKDDIVGFFPQTSNKFIRGLSTDVETTARVTQGSMQHTRELLNCKSDVCRDAKGAEILIIRATRIKKTQHFNFMSFLIAFNKYLNFKDKFNSTKKVFYNKGAKISISSKLKIIN